MERSKNFFKRNLISFGTNFRIDCAYPEMGLSGTDVYKMYGVTDDGSSASQISLSSSGFMSITNDRTIQIMGGVKNQEKAEDIVIIGKKGNVSISAEGNVRIRATSIEVEADEDINFSAGRNINFKAGGGRILLDSKQIDIEGKTGLLIDQLGRGFVTRVFEGSRVGADVLTSILSGSPAPVLNTVVQSVPQIFGSSPIGQFVGGLF